MIAEHAYVINLDRRPDRLASFMRRWEEIGAPIPLTIVRGIDGELLDPAPQWEQLGPGARGCYKTHMRLLATKFEPVLVLEDDAIFAEDFPASLEIVPPSDWDMVYLGGEHGHDIGRPGHAGLLRAPGVMRTHAYVARRPNRLARLLATHEHQGRHVDDVLRTPTLTRYAASPFTVGQASGPSDIQPTGLTRDQYWNPAWLMFKHRGSA